MFTTDDTVEESKLKELGKIAFVYKNKCFLIFLYISENSEHLQNLLCNPHLRNFITDVDKSEDAWKAMKIAMLEPLFIEFADECLKILEPQSPTQPNGI